MENTWADTFYDHFVPVSRYEEIQPDIMDIYEEAYHLPELKDYRKSTSTSEFCEKAITAHTNAPNYTPAEPIFSIIYKIRRLKVFFKILLYLIIIVAAVFSLNTVQDASFKAHTFLDLAEFLSPTLVAVIGLYIHTISANKRVIQRFNEDLSVSPGKIKATSRNDPCLFANMIWNRSLCGGSIHIGLGLLLLFRIISERFYQFLINMICQHMDVFLEYNSTRKVIWELYRRFRDTGNS